MDPTSHLKFISPQLQAARAFGTQRQSTWPPSAAGLGLDPTSHLKFISPKLQAAAAFIMAPKRPIAIMAPKRPTALHGAKTSRAKTSHPLMAPKRPIASWRQNVLAPKRPGAKKVGAKTSHHHMAPKRPTTSWRQNVLAPKRRRRQNGGAKTVAPKRRRQKVPPPYIRPWPDSGPIEDCRGDSNSPETLVLGEANLTLETLEF